MKEEAQAKLAEIQSKPQEVSPVEDVVAPKLKREGHTVITKDNSKFTFEIFDGINGKVEKVEDRQNKDKFSFTIRDEKGMQVGIITFWKDTDGKFFSNNSFVKEEYRGKGLASALYDYAKELGVDIKPSKIQTEGGKALWEKLNRENEGIPTTNPTADGNISFGVDNLGENGITETKSDIQESVPSSINGGANKREVSVVFKDNKDLQDIGSEEQYLEHLNAIFPDSKTKKTVYHGGSLNKNDKIKKTNFFNHFFFTSSKDYAASYSKDKSGVVQTAILNIKNLANARELLEAEGIEVTSGNLLKVTNSNDVAKELMSEGYDGVYAEDADENTKELNFDEYVVFDPEQIHILGSKKDMEMFQNHVSKSKPVDGGEVKGDVEVSDLDHAKSQIDKGILNWDGNIANERIDLGLSWADIRKGEADIKRGKENSVPAKRLIEAIAKAKKEGGYHYKQGIGGESQRAKLFVSLDDVQRANNEYQLTDAEQKEINTNESKLIKRHEEHFDSLDKETQTEILENYENRQKEVDNKGEIPTDSKIGESKSDVPDGQIAKKPTTKEKIAERIKLSDANIDATNDVVKAKIKAFMDMFPSADINPDDYKQNGLNMDAIIDMVAKAAKVIAKGGIVTSEHIKEAIKGYNTVFDDEIDPKAVEESINPKKEESKSNDSRREKNSSEKASDLGINEKQYLDLGDKIKEIPETGVFKKYLSGDTIEREYGTANNDQSYDAVTLQDIAKHGDDVINQAKELFGDTYIEKTLDYLQSANLNSFEKGVVFASLENLMDTKVKSDPKNKQLLKLQELVYADSQANLRSASLGINTGRLRSVYNAI